ncbi:hyalin-like [Ptychodera flava]|uniref:hyalin-like n=1 Tax=Ptychodera flava TaxID=63121 RepID=UPI00396A9D3C
MDSPENVAFCAFIVTVIDDNKPITIDCPLDVSQSTDLGLPTATVSWNTPNVTYNCDVGQQVVCDVPSNSTFQLGITEVTCSATDSSNNIMTCIFTVTVIDTEEPTIDNCLEHVTTSAGPKQNTSIVNWLEPSAVDNSGDSVRMVSTIRAPSRLKVGVHRAVYLFTDTSGNMAFCNLTITIEDFDECQTQFAACDHSCLNEPGTYRCVCNSGYGSGDIGQCIDIDECAANGTGECDQECINTDGSFLCQCSSGYTLTPDGLSCTDTEVPNIFGCPENITTSIEDGNTAARVKWNLPSATDNSQIPPTMNSTHNPGEYFTVGDSNVEYVFTDSSGNRAVCSFTITVLDTLPPEIKYCPDNVTIFADPGENSTIVTWFPPLATDNSGPLSSITSTARPRQFFQIGKTEVVYVFADLFSNTASCAFYVTVIGEFCFWAMCCKQILSLSSI